MKFLKSSQVRKLIPSSVSAVLVVIGMYSIPFAEQEPPMAKISYKDTVSWEGQFTKREQAEIRSFFDSKGLGYRLYGWSRVLKEDIDGDGSPEYIVNAVIKTAKKGIGSESFFVLRRTSGGFSFLTYKPAEHDPGLNNVRRIYTLDIDGDGRKEIVDQRAYDTGNGVPPFYALVLNYEDSRLSPAYVNESYAPVTFEDLDDDGILELIELANEFNVIHPDGLWPIVYAWDGKRYKDSSYRFKDFYAGKLLEFKEILEDTLRSQREREMKFGKGSLLKKNIIAAMKRYIQRIQNILSQ
jgi:hypothetical protein